MPNEKKMAIKMASICLYLVANHEALTTIWIRIVNCLCAFCEGPNDPSGKVKIGYKAKLSCKKSNLPHF